MRNNDSPQAKVGTDFENSCLEFQSKTWAPVVLIPEYIMRVILDLFANNSWLSSKIKLPSKTIKLNITKNFLGRPPDMGHISNKLDGIIVLASFRLSCSNFDEFPRSIYERRKIKNTFYVLIIYETVFSSVMLCK